MGGLAVAGILNRWDRIKETIHWMSKGRGMGQSVALLYLDSLAPFDDQSTYNDQSPFNDQPLPSGQSLP